MTLDIKADRNDPGTPLKHFWSVCVGAGRANEGLRAGWLEQLRTVHDACGFRYCRFHGLFHDDMFVYREEEGVPTYNFQYVDDLFDRMLDIGVRPFVELGFCPSDLARQTGTVFWWKANGAPPKDYAKWAELVRRTVSHWVERYGIDEVRTWYFEVWNEPNLHPFFKGTKSEYFELYRASVNVIKAIDPHLRVGGPATSNFVPDARFAGETEDFSQHGVVTGAKDLDALDWRPVWVTDFMNFCQREKLPVDFISCHPYPTDWALDAIGETVKSTRNVDATRHDLALVRRLVDSSPFPKAEIHLTEWSSSPSPRDFTHDYPQAATFIVKANLESAGSVDSLSYWVFTDIFEESGGGNTPFHGGFGMINYQGIPKPAFHAYRFLHALGNERLAQTPGAVITRDSSTKKVKALAYHYPPEEPLSAPASFDTRQTAEQTLAKGKPLPFHLKLTGLPPGSTVRLETLSPKHGNALAAWQSIGSPDSPTSAQTKLLREAAWATEKELIQISANGTLQLTKTLVPWTLLFVEQV